MGYDVERDAVPKAVKIAEGRALKKLWDKRSEQPDAKSQAAFSTDVLGRSPGYLPQFFQGMRPLTLRVARHFADYIGCEIEDFSQRLADEAERPKTITLTANELKLLDLYRLMDEDRQRETLGFAAYARTISHPAPVEIEAQNHHRATAAAPPKRSAAHEKRARAARGK